ncbi:tripartite motif-containing protein 16-like [Pholidichthys leucotaenia]
MAQKRVCLDRETFSCLICQDLVKDPVTIPCRHSYCMNCIRTHWDEEEEKGIYSCPECRKTFRPRPDLRPDLVKNIMLSALVEDLKKTGLQAAPADHCNAGPEDVVCDVCTGRKLKAVKSCLVCLVSYCETHLQPHCDSQRFKKHNLVNPCQNLQGNICSRHDEVRKIFCCTDQQSICYLCTMEEHKVHETVPTVAERTEKQKELEMSRLKIHQRIQDREKDVKVLKQEVEAINGSTDKAVEDNDKIFTELILLIQKINFDVKQQIRSQQETEVSQMLDLQEKLEQEISDLKRKDAELEQLLKTEDHNQFLHNYPSLSALSESTHSSSIDVRPLSYFEDVTAAVSETRDKLQELLTETWTNISETVKEVDVLLSPPEPKTREEFLKYSCKITLDPNTAHTMVLISKKNKKVKLMSKTYTYPHHPDRFNKWFQVLSRKSLSGCRYWEVEWRGGIVGVAVMYKNISRGGNEFGFGYNNKSWSLYCNTDRFSFCHDKVQTPISGPGSSRVGVFLDHRAGVLSFYSISETITLLHKVQTTFTQPLHAGVRFLYEGSTAEFIKLK